METSIIDGNLCEELNDSTSIEISAILIKCVNFLLFMITVGKLYLDCMQCHYVVWPVLNKCNFPAFIQDFKLH